MNHCKECHTTFSKASNFKRHLKKIHGIEAAVIPKRGDLKSASYYKNNNIILSDSHNDINSA